MREDNKETRSHAARGTQAWVGEVANGGLSVPQYSDRFSFPLWSEPPAYSFE